MNFIKKHKKVLIIAAVILVVLIIAAVVIAIILNKQSEKSDNSEDLKRAQELITNNFLYSYLMQGDIVTADGYIEESGTTYYYVNDDQLSSIKSIEDINNLVSETFIEDKANIYYENLINGNKYIEKDGTLYVAKNADICSNVMKYEADEISLAEVTEDKMQIRLSNQIVYAYKENGNWYLGTNNCYCMDNSTDN